VPYELLPIFTTLSSKGQIAAIVNGASKKALSHAKELSTLSLPVDIFISEYPGHSIELAKNAALKGSTTLIAVGGDGTVSEVLNGIMQAKASTPNIDPVLTILPAGTANDMAHTISASNELADLEKALLQGKTSRVDIGKILHNENGNEHKRYFINIASIGLGAQVVKKLESSQKRLGADLSFLLEVTRTFFSYKRTSIECQMDHEEWSGEVLALAVANGKRFGSGLYIAPHAEMNDGKLEVVILGKISKLDYILNIGKLKKGVRVEHPEAYYFSVSSISIKDSSGGTMLEADGEFLGSANCKIEILPVEISLLTWP